VVCPDPTVGASVNALSAKERRFNSRLWRPAGAECIKAGVQPRPGIGWGAFLALLIAGSRLALSAEYAVGPGRALIEIDQVPWESLAAGDTVSIHWRAEPYRSKWVIGVRGTEEKPVTVRGVPNGRGELPVIEGRDAATRAALNYWHEPRSVIKVGGANVPADTTPAHIVIENLEVRGGRPPFHYRGRAGPGGYTEYAAGIFIEKGENITIRNCVLTDNANGLLVASQARDVLVERCWIHGNGVEGSVYAHNVYSSAAGMTFQFNRFGPLRAGCPGNNLKDRSAGLAVRCNWIEGGNQQLDLVDAEDRESLRLDARYHRALVFGNILIEPPSDGRDSIVHFGGDSGKADWYRRGPLRFYHNTVVTFRPGNTTLFRLSSRPQVVDARNNLFAAVAGGRLTVLDGDGTIELHANWLNEGWRNNLGRERGTVVLKGGLLTGEAAGFVNAAARNFYLLPTAPVTGKARPLESGALPKAWLESEYQPHRERWDMGGAEWLDLGAFQLRTAR